MHTHKIDYSCPLNPSGCTVNFACISGSMDEKSCSLNPINLKIKKQIEYRLNLEFFEAEIQAQLWLNHQGIHANDKVVDYNNISALITDLLAMGAITVRVSDR